MRVVYCTSCREMIDRKDIESGRAILYNKASYCPKCTLEASWSDSARAEPIAPLSSKDTLPGAVPRRRSSGLSGPVSSAGRTARTRRASTSGIERVEASAGAASPRPMRRDSSARVRSGRKSYGLAIGVGVAVFALVAILSAVVLFSGDGGAPSGTPEDPRKPEKADYNKILYEQNLTIDKGYSDSLDDRKSSVRLWREGLTKLAGTSYGSHAEDRLRDACQKFLDRTTAEAQAAESENDTTRAIALLEGFLEVVDSEPWAAKVKVHLARIRSKREVPRPNDTWTTFFDGREDHAMCLDPKHTFNCWQKDDKKLVGQGSADGKSFTHLKDKYRDFNLYFEYRIQSSAGGFLVHKPQAFEIALPATADEARNAWHDIVVQSKADRVRVWIDGKEVSRTYPSQDVDQQIQFHLTPSGVVEVRNVKLLKLP